MNSLPQDSPVVNSEPAAAFWPLWTDSWFWCTTDEDEVSVLEAIELERLQDLVDAPQPSAGERAWAEWLIENSLPPVCGGGPEDDEPFEPSVQDWEDYRTWAEALDRQRDNPMTDEDVMRAGLPVG
jgi:hypothetical protein